MLDTRNLPASNIRLRKKVNKLKKLHSIRRKTKPTILKKITSWHAPRTSSVADQILKNVQLPKLSDEIIYIGISAWSRTQYETVADAIWHFGWQARWVERAIWDDESSQMISCTCVEADSWCEDLEKRLKWIRSEIPYAPIVLILSYPRESEMDEIRAAGVSEVVSKPFELCDLRLAILRSTESEASASLEI